MDRRRQQFQVKSLSQSDQDGTFEAIVSVFGNVDEGGDRVMPGAFTKTIERTGGVFPIVWSHMWSTVPIGKTISAEETAEGLLVKGILLIGQHELADQVYANFKAGVPLEFSFSYDIMSAGWVEEDGQDIFELRELDVLEVGPTLIGMNRDTRLAGVKSGQSSDPLALLQEIHAAVISGNKSAADGAAAQLAAIREQLDSDPELAKLVAALAATPSSPDKPSAQDAPSDPSGSSPTPDLDEILEPLSPEATAEFLRYLTTPA